MYIYRHSQTVLLYRNYSLWLYTRNVFSCDQSPTEFMSDRL